MTTLKFCITFSIVSSCSSSLVTVVFAPSYLVFEPSPCRYQTSLPYLKTPPFRHRSKLSNKTITYSYTFLCPLLIHMQIQKCNKVRYFTDYAFSSNFFSLGVHLFVVVELACYMGTFCPDFSIS